MSETQLQGISNWLLKMLANGEKLTADDLIREAEGRYSPSDITWAIWYLKSDGKIRLTKDDAVAAA